ncbi:DUF202 domain-containing protein [Streptomyces sp. KM273126]|uniref:DUF202 domain-containing protein n=1 Tax=Streptomyces sp. KM273126 TaxID=2545247 RepID=UPI0010392BA8|nr:DUF202 domain-containing protein [Streptomyces sp. KM273126]MBA2809749.1 DUF202 domain-containing protein [Streptomyces sp. KM273126]
MNPPRDPGLQPERTALARQRTALSALVAAALLLRGGLTAGAPLQLAAAVCLAVAAALVAAVGTPRPGTRATRRRLLAAAWVTGLGGSLATLHLLTT